MLLIIIDIKSNKSNKVKSNKPTTVLLEEQIFLNIFIYF